MTEPSPLPRSRAVVFDLGGVLLDWNPRHLYRKLIPDETAMEDFLARICTQEWNERQDCGRPFAEGIAEMQALYPDEAHLIAAYFDRWLEMLPNAHADTVSVLKELKDRATPLYALTNFSAETFALAKARFDFLGWFHAIVVSGEERVIKPDRRIFEILAKRTGLAPQDSVFIDDVEKNVDAAKAFGLDAVRFTDAGSLRRDLVQRGLLD